MTNKTKDNTATMLLVARPPSANSVELAFYMDGQERVIISNAPDPTDTSLEFASLVDTSDGASMVLTDADKQIVDRKVLEQFAKVGTCTHCESEILSSTAPEHVDALVEACSTVDGTMDINCPHCSEKASIDVTMAIAASSDDDEEDADEEDADEEDADEEGEEDADEEGEEDADEEEGEEEDDEDEEGEEDADEDEDEEEEKSTVSDAKKEETPAQAPAAAPAQAPAQAPAAAPTEPEVASSAAAEPAKGLATGLDELMGKLTAIFEGDDSIEKAATSDPQFVTIDVAQEAKFTTGSLVVTPIRSGVFAVFADSAEEGKGGHPINLGTLHVEQASASNKALMTDMTAQKLRALNAGFAAAVRNKDELSPFGWVSVVHQVPVTEVAAAIAAQSIEAASTQAAHDASAAQAIYKQSLSIAATGMAKGIWGENPLAVRLAAELSARRFQNAESLADVIVAAVMPDLSTALIDRAAELAGQTDEVRNATAKVVETARPARAVSPAAAPAALDDVSTAVLASAAPTQTVNTPQKSKGKDGRQGTNRYRGLVKFR